MTAPTTPDQTWEFSGDDRAPDAALDSLASLLVDLVEQETIEASSTTCAQKTPPLRRGDAS